LNGIYLPPSKSFGVAGGKILREDYLGNPNDVVPAADPHVVSESQRLQRAIAVKQAAMTTPGYALAEVEKDYLKALQVEGIDRLYPGPDKVPPLPNPKMMVEQVKMQGKQMEFQHEKAMFAAELMEQQRVDNAEIAKLEADALKILEEAKATGSTVAINALNAYIGVLKHHEESLRGRIELILKGLENDREASAMQQGGVPGMAGRSSNAASSTASPA